MGKDSTEQLIKDAEGLVGKRDAGKAPRTKQIVRESEELIGRQPTGGSKATLILFILAGAVVGAVAFLLKK